MSFPTEIFYQLLSHDYQINNLRFVNKETYHACSDDAFWLNIHSYYGDQKIKPMLEKDALSTVKKVYAYFNQIDNQYTISSARLFASEYYLIVQQLSLPYQYFGNNEPLVIIIKDNVYKIKIIDVTMNINRHQLFQLLFNLYQLNKEVTKLTYIKL